VISQVLNEVPKSLREIRPELSDEFEAIVLKAIAKDRKDRYTDANEMLADLNAVLDDPTHSTERARITGPRRLLPRAPKIPRIAWAIGGAGLVAAGVAIAVAVLMGSKAKKAMSQKPPIVAFVDAGVGAVPAAIDAGPAELSVETIQFRIVTVPPNAEVYRESEFVGTSPTKPLSFVKNNKEVKITAQLPGYDDATLTINPLERTAGSDVMLKLNKSKGERKTTKIKPIGTANHGTGSGGTGTGGTQVKNQTGGELSTNPFAGSGTVPNK
jgi:hypothetical protein